MKEKSSTAYLFECYIWLVNTLARGPISRADLDRKWARSNANAYGQDSLPESNFHRWRRTVELIFDITIACNSNNEYYIAEMDKSHDADLHNRLLTIMGVNSLLKDSKNLRDKILFEPVPSGDKFLAPIIEALRDEYAIQITHQGFGKAYPSTYLAGIPIALNITVPAEAKCEQYPFLFSYKKYSTKSFPSGSFPGSNEYFVFFVTALLTSSTH